jgi:23S rRNA (uridine2552-2'-O)-methyltransferase
MIDKPGGPGERTEAVRLRSGRGRTTSQQNWLKRQLNDPYVAAARKQGFRSRAAFKLIELDDKFHLITKGARILDLGAAPGGWCHRVWSAWICCPWTKSAVPR